MKTLLFLFLSITVSAQCETTHTAQPFYAIPSFLNLYLSGQCISEQLHDTTICTRVYLTDQPQLAAFSYSTPNGSPVYITSVKQYDESCTYLTDGTQIPQGEGYVNVCYEIQTGLIDNFCPYTLFMGGLSVDFCGEYAYYSDKLHIRFITCSNSGTSRYEVLQSTDAVMWRTIHSVLPFVETSSVTHDYNLTLDWNQGGLNYFCIREVDVNGQVTVSDVFYCEIPYPSVQNSSGIDLLGRKVSNSRYMYYVQPKR